MTSHDMRDILNLPSSGAPRPAKKQKTAGSRPNLKGLQREVQSLGGDNPISIVPEVPLFKKRRLASRKPAARWDMKPFRNSARCDNLVLRHWRRKTEAPPVVPMEGIEGVEGTQAEAATEPEIDDSGFAKYNVEINLPEYDEAEYEANLTSKDWSKTETDYLLSVVRSFDLRWPVIWDRYEFSPDEIPKPAEGETSTALVVEPKVRSMEDLKARYYEVAAKMMALRTPVQYMSQPEFNLHSTMANFDAQQEKARKLYAENAMARTAEEKGEEESLLKELKRIMARSDRLNEERKELYARLAAPPSTTSALSQYTGSQGLTTLVQQLATADKNRKRKSILGPEGASPTVASGQNPSLERRDSMLRESISGPSTSGKKGGNNAADRRKLTPDEEALFGVSHHERLNQTGPFFRYDRVSKLIGNKSAVQQAKITNTLTELDIPPRLVMPTIAVVAQYEALLASINMLLDTRKVTDKIDGEIKLAETLKAEREKKEREARGEYEPESKPEAAADGAEGQGDAEMADAGAEDGAGDVKAEDTERDQTPIPSARGGSMHKRSASVLSQMSDKSSKRQKK